MALEKPTLKERISAQSVRMGSVIQRLSRFRANIVYSVCVRRKKKEKPGTFCKVGN